MTAAGATTVSLLVIAGVTLTYLVVALVFPEKF